MGTQDRLDKVLARLLPADITLSRSRLQELIQSGEVFLDGQVQTNVKFKLSGGENVEIRFPKPKALELEAENISISIVYEDDDVIVVDKAAGMVVHPGTGAWSGTLVHALLYHCGDSLSGIGGVERPGIVHRIDKDTSGLLVVAKNDHAHLGLGAQFRKHSIHRLYRAFCYGVPHIGDPKLLGQNGVDFEGGRLTVNLPIGRHKHDRLRMAVREDGKHAVTHVALERAHHSGALAEVACMLETGRTHQIRVHMSHIGFPLLGDPIYGKGARQLSKEVEDDLRRAVEELQGQALHAAELGFVHPRTGEDMMFKSPLREDMAKVSKLMSQGNGN